MRDVKQENRLLTTRQLAQILNVHINTVRRWSNSGTLKARRIGPRGDRRFSREEVNRFLTNKSDDLSETDNMVPFHG